MAAPRRGSYLFPYTKQLINSAAPAAAAAAAAAAPTTRENNHIFFFAKNKTVTIYLYNTEWL